MKKGHKEVLREVKEVDYIIAIPVEEFDNLDELLELVEEANKENIEVTMHAEHSNFHQGVLVQLKHGKE